jgi:hypothetical protein
MLAFNEGMVVDAVSVVFGAKIALHSSHSNPSSLVRDPFGVKGAAPICSAATHELSGFEGIYEEGNRDQIPELQNSGLCPIVAIRLLLLWKSYRECLYPGSAT